MRTRGPATISGATSGISLRFLRDQEEAVKPVPAAGASPVKAGALPPLPKGPEWQLPPHLKVRHPPPRAACRLHRAVSAGCFAAVLCGAVTCVVGCWLPPPGRRLLQEYKGSQSDRKSLLKWRKDRAVAEAILNKKQ